ncbi:MAG: hypothetical protein Q4P06_08020 [Actinomycetaceae bacterium]|nr:hypothetical protein [Actinomycetaceae bacterium]
MSETHEHYRSILFDQLSSRQATADELAHAAAEFLQCSKRYVDAYDMAIKAGWSQSELRQLPDPTKPIKNTVRKRKRKPAPPSTDVHEG